MAACVKRPAYLTIRVAQLAQLAYFASEVACPLPATARLSNACRAACTCAAGLRLDRPSTAIDATVSRKRRFDIYQLLHRISVRLTPCAAPVARPAALSACRIGELVRLSLIALARLVLIRLPTDALRKQRLNLLRNFTYRQCLERN